MHSLPIGTPSHPGSPFPPGYITPADMAELIDRYSSWGTERRRKSCIYKYYLAEDEIDEPTHAIQAVNARYRARVKDRGILLRNKLDPKKHVLKPYIVRGSDAYTTRTMARMHHVRHEWDLAPGAASMITIAPRAVGSIWQIHQKLKAAWPKYTDWLRKRGWLGRYVWAMEPTKRHYSHYHLVVGYVWDPADKGQAALDMVDWWKAHGLDIEAPGVEITIMEDDPCSYALKYVEKGVRDGLWQSIMWMAGSRMWGVGKGVMCGGLGRGGVETNSERITEWEYVGCPTKEWWTRHKKAIEDGEYGYEEAIEIYGSPDHPPPLTPPRSEGVEIG